MSQGFGIGPVQDYILDLGNLLGNLIQQRLISVDDLVDDHVEQPVETIDVLLFGTGAHRLKQCGIGASNGDQEVGTKEDIDIIELQFLPVMHVLQHRENVVIVLFGLGPLRPMATVLDLKLVQSEARRKFVEFGRSRICDVIPRQVRE